MLPLQTLASFMKFDTVRYDQSSKCFRLIQTSTLLRVSVYYYMENIRCNAWMHFHEDMAKNIFIMIVSHFCDEVKSFVKGPL